MKQLYKFYLQFKELNLLLFLQLMVFVLLFLSITVNHDMMQACIAFMMNILSFASYYYVYRIYKKIIKHAELETEIALLENQKHIQEEHLTLSKENHRYMEELKDRIAIEITDFEVSNRKDAREQVQELLHKYADLYSIDYCKNKIIDAILFNKLQVAKSLQIRCDVQLALPEALNMKDIDIMFLFNNLLDNAIEACEKLPQIERFIEIEAMMKANVLCVCVRNAKDHSIKIDRSFMKSTKDDPEHHGLGLQIIKRICKNYDGDFRIDDQGDVVIMYATINLSSHM